MSTVFHVPKNNAGSTLATNYTASSGTMDVVDASSFGSPNSGVPGRIYVTDGTNFSIYSVTGISLNTLVIAGVLEGSTDHSYVSGSTVEDRVTAGYFTELQTAVNAGGAALAIGSAVTSVTDNSVLYADASGNLASSSHMIFNGTQLTLSGANLSVTPSSTTNVASVVQGLSGQVDNLQEWRIFGGTPISAIGPDGYAFIDKSVFVLANGTDLVNATNATNGGGVVSSHGRLWKWKANVITNPSGGGFTFDIKKNSTSIFGTPITVPVSTVGVLGGNSFSTSTVAENDLMTINISSAGTGVQYVVITVYYLVGNE